jgi:toxin ParE1/3/4
MKLAFEPEARAEFLKALQRYNAEAGTVIADGFKNEVAAKLSTLAENPALGPIALHDIRRFPLHRFPFTIFYRIKTDTLQIIAVAHQSRMPEYWRRRG